MQFRFFSPQRRTYKSYRSRQELSNNYLLAKVGVDKAENEPLKIWTWFNPSIHSPTSPRAGPSTTRRAARRTRPAPRRSARTRSRARGGARGAAGEPGLQVRMRVKLELRIYLNVRTYKLITRLKC